MPETVRETILFVVDEALFGAAVPVLESHGYTVYSATGGDEALSLYREHRSEIDVVVSDVASSGKANRQLCDVLNMDDRTVRFVFSTGHGVLAADVLAETDSEVPLIAKPKILGRLTRAVSEAMQSATAARKKQRASTLYGARERTGSMVAG